MAFTRESLNAAISLKLADIDTASGMHRTLFTLTQAGGICAAAGALLVAPLAIEVAVIAGFAGATLYGISQLLQSQRLGYFLPLPGVPVSVEQFAYVPGVLVAQLMSGTAPVAPEPVEIIPTDWLPQRERRINYLLTHAADLLIAAAESAQDGISFAAIVDSAVRASEYAITDEQINNPVLALKLAPEVRALIQGDTSQLEAKQRAAIAGEWQRAQREHAAGLIASDELDAISVEVSEIAPDVIQDDPIITTSTTANSDVVKTTPIITTVAESPLNATEAGESVRSDWQAVFGLVKDQDRYPAIAVIGAQGKGKTTLVNYLLSLLNRDKIVLDPHYKMGDWPGCLVIGAGMNYDAVGEALANIATDVKARYQERATVPGYQPQPVTLVLEEQTNWAEKVTGADKFLKQTLSDIRKVGYQSISVAHSDTNTARGGAKGTRKMRDDGELKIVLIEKGLAKVSIKGRQSFLLRYPDPAPHTKVSGSPIIASSGALSSAAICDQYADRYSTAHSQNSAWHQFKVETTYPGMSAVMTWIENTRKPQFCPRDARDNKSLRTQLAVHYESAQITAEIRAIFDALVTEELLERSGEDGYQRCAD